jgi:hypothetical protein
MFSTHRAPGGAQGLTALPRPALRGAILACAAQLQHVANLARSAAEANDLDVGVDHLVTGVAELRSDLALLKASARPLR